MSRTAPRLQTLVAATIFVGVTALCARYAAGQDFLQAGAGRTGEFQTDRSAFTPSTTVTGKSVGLLEASYVYINNRNAPDTHSWPELLTRYGVSPRVELRLGWDIEIGGGGNIVSANEGGEGIEGDTIAVVVRHQGPSLGTGRLDSPQRRDSGGIYTHQRRQSQQPGRAHLRIRLGASGPHQT